MLAADIAIAEAAEAVIAVHDALEQFSITGAGGLRAAQPRQAASFFRVVIRSRSRGAFVGSSIRASASSGGAVARVNLQVVPRVGKIEAFITKREIRNDVLQNGVIQRRPVGK